MSDRVTNAEVEDVLSSIRRLVSDDFRTVRRVSNPEMLAEVSDNTEKPAQARLVLTPALRVEEMQEQVARPGAEPEFVSGRAPQPTANLADEDKDQAADDVSEWDETTSENTADFDVDARFEDVPESESIPKADVLELAPGDRLGNSQDEASTVFRHLRPENAELAAKETDDSADAPTERAEDTDKDTRTDTLVLTAADKKPDEAASDPEVRDDDEKGTAETDSIEPRIYFRRTSTRKELAAKITALEETIARTPDQWEPDGESVDDYSGTSVETLAWEDHVELDGSGNPVTQTSEQSEEKDDFPQAIDPDDEVLDLSADLRDDTEQQDYDAAPEDAILDEEALRELVSDIVRQELQGVLGERITRNVRKLVRREIQRALTAQDFE
jgi:hypothetical protein